KHRDRRRSSHLSPCRKQEHRNARDEEDRLERAAEQMQANPQTEQDSVSHAVGAGQSRQRSEHQASRRRGVRASPIGVGPLTERAEFENSQKTAEKRPDRCRPAAEHPVTESAKNAG